MTKPPRPPLGLGDRLDRHLARRYLGSFLAVLVGVCTLYAVIDFADRASAYTGPAWVSWVLRLYGNRLAKVSVLVSPAAMLIAGGLTLSALRRSSELSAALAAGRAPGRLVLPLALVALLAGVAIYEFDDAVAVHAALRAERIGAEHFQMWGSYRTYFAPKRWVRLDQRILHLGDPLPGGGFRDPSIFELSDHFSLVRRIDADAMIPLGGAVWRLKMARVRTFEGNGSHERSEAELRLELPGGDRLGEVAPGQPGMLSRAELRRQIRIREALGLDPSEELFEYYSRVAYVLVGFAGTLLAAALALRAGRKGHVATSLLEGLIVSGLLWGLLGVAQALSLAGRLPAWACAFAPELLGVAIGLALLRQTNRRAAW